MMRLVLEQRGGHKVVLAAEGRDGLAKAMAAPPDLAIIDVMMPGLTGYQLCRELRANPDTADVPILILTARAQPADRDAALEAGANDYMTKPVMMAELLERVEALLAGGGAQAQASEVAGTFVLVSLRGGVGVTTLAVNLAVMLAQASDGGSCLVDLCPSSGHVALQLGLRPDPNWSTLGGGTGALDADSVGAHLIQHSSGLHVLASPFVPVVGQGAVQGNAQALLRVLREQFPIVVVDAPPVLDETTVAVIESASAVGLVLTAEPASIQTAVGTLRALQQWSGKVHVILNQVVPGELPPAEALARALKRQIAVSVPFELAQAQTLAGRSPLVLSGPDSGLVQAVQGLAKTFVMAAQA
jgi:CheY-like chemotaxis protein/MinD-like ATPase involved in chromosome partitioning or flagellar assembly